MVRERIHNFYVIFCVIPSLFSKTCNVCSRLFVLCTHLLYYLPLSTRLLYVSDLFPSPKPPSFNVKIRLISLFRNSSFNINSFQNFLLLFTQHVYQLVSRNFRLISRSRFRDVALPFTYWKIVRLSPHPRPPTPPEVSIRDVKF